mmetsp:Transcript_21740/g.39920  ORF Transcript_21740/g.39920 Transcript_21740/m.39920 type:complete len:203 (+) Transcript_21740:1392-2000(+)
MHALVHVAAVRRQGVGRFLQHPDMVARLARRKMFLRWSHATLNLAMRPVWMQYGETGVTGESQAPLVVQPTTADRAKLKRRQAGAVNQLRVMRKSVWRWKAPNHVSRTKIVYWQIGVYGHLARAAVSVCRKELAELRAHPQGMERRARATSRKLCSATPLQPCGEPSRPLAATTRQRKSLSATSASGVNGASAPPHVKVASR